MKWKQAHKEATLTVTSESNNNQLLLLLGYWKNALQQLSWLIYEWFFVALYVFLCFPGHFMCLHTAISAACQLQVSFTHNVHYCKFDKAHREEFKRTICIGTVLWIIVILPGFRVIFDLSRRFPNMLHNLWEQVYLHIQMLLHYNSYIPSAYHYRCYVEGLWFCSSL